MEWGWRWLGDDHVAEVVVDLRELRVRLCRVLELPLVAMGADEDRGVDGGLDPERPATRSENLRTRARGEKDAGRADLLASPKKA